MVAVLKTCFSHRKIFSIKLLFSHCFIFLFIFCDLDFARVSCERKIYTNTFSVQVKPAFDDEREIDSLAADHGFINRGKVADLDGYYSLEHPKLSKRSTDHGTNHHTALLNDHRVLWAEHQRVLKRTKRSVGNPDVFTDPLFKDQWYINKGAKHGYDMKVAEAWKKGFTGKGIVVTILDDGIQPNHPDLASNYDPDASFDINDNDKDPTPQDNGENKHGSRCAGEVASIAGNEFCGVGIAFNSSIGGVRMLDGAVTDEVEAKALGLNPNHIDIYSASWGPEDDGKTVDGPGRLAKQAFIKGIKKGRKGKGSIFIWASGNGGRRNDNCNCDGYTNSIYTLSISSATQSGTKPWYLEECSSTLATTYSSGSLGTDNNIVTVDLDMSFIERQRLGLPPDLDKMCTKSHTGTSASAPIAAAICALSLEANPNLTWRDMQHIVVLTSRYEPLRFETGWASNGVGRNYSHKFGYGLMDAEAMVDLARIWRPLPVQRICESQVNEQRLEIPPHPDAQLEVFLNTTGCEGTINEVKYLEHVQTRIYLKFKPRGALKISLISPSGTMSDLLKPRLKDMTADSYDQWPFLSVHFWGENPKGIWKLIIKNDLDPSENPGNLLSWGMTFYGINETIPNYRDASLKVHFLPRDVDEKIRIEYHCFKRGLFFEPNSNSCVETCPEGQFAHLARNLYDEDERVSAFDRTTSKRVGGYCVSCNSQCAECYGPASDNCLSCKTGRFFIADKCVKDCPTNYYVDKTLGECLPCSSNCINCHGAPNRCTSCHSGFEYDPINHNCKPSCKTGECLDCPMNCHLCDRLKRNCIACLEGFRNLDGRCISDTCPQNYFESLQAGAQGFTKECVKCHETCRSCFGPSHQQCISCQDDRFLRNGICTSCPSGQFFNVTINGCDFCHNNCESCKGFKPTDCTLCKPLYRLNGNHCIPCCSANLSLEVMDGTTCCVCDTSSERCILSSDATSGQSLNGFNEIRKENTTYQLILSALSKASSTVILIVFISSLFILLLLVLVFRSMFSIGILSPTIYREYRVISDCDGYTHDKTSFNCDDVEEKEENHCIKA